MRNYCYNPRMSVSNHSSGNCKAKQIFIMNIKCRYRDKQPQQCNSGENKQNINCHTQFELSENLLCFLLLLLWNRDGLKRIVAAVHWNLCGDEEENKIKSGAPIR